jgi:hypothetical protein
MHQFVLLYVALHRFAYDRVVRTHTDSLEKESCHSFDSRVRCHDAENPETLALVGAEQRENGGASFCCHSIAAFVTGEALGRVVFRLREEGIIDGKDLIGNHVERTEVAE